MRDYLAACLSARFTLFSLFTLSLVTFGAAQDTMTGGNTGGATGGAMRSQSDLQLLTDPFLQLPTENSVRVVWFTEFLGQTHTVSYGEGFSQSVQAETTKLSRVAEDEDSRVGEQTGDEEEPLYEGVTPRDVWRHEAEVTGLSARVPYFVTSVDEEGAEVRSDPFTLAPLPAEGAPLQILLTSDHQLKEMTPANLQKVEETVGQVDAVFLSGDLINIPDRASEWFDDNRGFAFFPSLQGKADYTLEHETDDGVVSATYRGGELIQHAPLFPVVGNHEVMGRYNLGQSLNEQFGDPQPQEVAQARYEQLREVVNPGDDPEVRAQWLRDNSFNTVTYEELFTLPDSGPAGEHYYLVRYGDVAMIGLYATRIWRTPSMDDDAKGKYREAEEDLNIPANWGYGDFVFEDLSVDSEQYAWLIEQLQSEAFQSAPYKVVLMHQGPHGVGDNYNPVFANPQQIIDYAEDGRIDAVRYEYPLEADILVRDVEPLLSEAGVQLVHQGHSHLWFRLQNEAGVTFLETSNVGNSYGCYVEGYDERGNVPDDPRYHAENYVKVGDPHGLEPIPPSVTAPQQDEAGNDLPCITSSELTAFSILDTGTGTVKSYVFNTLEPNSEVQLFDEFALTE